MSKPVPLFNADDPQRHPKKADPIVPGILHRPKLTTMWGAPGSGKSHLAIDLACTCAQTYNVVYVAAEAVEEFLPRLEAWKTRYDKTLGNLWFWSEPLVLLNKDHCQKFAESITALQPTVLFIDPLAECFVGGDENATKDMTIAVRNINILRTQLQVAVCLLHHSGWGDSHERGSSVLRGATRMNLSVRIQGETITLKGEKCNAGPLLPERYFKVLEVSSTEHTVVIPSGREQHPITGSLPKRQRELLAGLAMSVFREGVAPAELAAFVNLPRATFYSVVNALVDRGLASKHAKTGLIALTDLGETVATDLKTDWTGIRQDSENLPAELNWNLIQSSVSPMVFQQNSNDIPVSNTSAIPESKKQSSFVSLETGLLDDGLDLESETDEKEKVM